MNIEEQESVLPEGITRDDVVQAIRMMTPVDGWATEDYEFYRKMAIAFGVMHKDDHMYFERMAVVLGLPNESQREELKQRTDDKGEDMDFSEDDMLAMVEALLAWDTTLSASPEADERRRLAAIAKLEDYAWAAIARKKMTSKE